MKMPPGGVPLLLGFAGSSCKAPAPPPPPPLPPPLSTAVAALCAILELPMLAMGTAAAAS